MKYRPVRACRSRRSIPPNSYSYEQEETDVLGLLWSQSENTDPAPHPSGKTRTRRSYKKTKGSTNKMNSSEGKRAKRAVKPKARSEMKLRTRKSMAFTPETQSAPRSSYRKRKSLPPLSFDDSSDMPSPIPKTSDSDVTTHKKVPRRRRKKASPAKLVELPRKVFDSAFFFRANVDRMEKYYKKRLESGLAGPEIDIATGDIIGGDESDVESVEIGDLAESREMRSIQQKAFRRASQVPLWKSLNEHREEEDMSSDQEVDGVEEETEDDEEENSPPDVGQLHPKPTHSKAFSSQKDQNIIKLTTSKERGISLLQKSGPKQKKKNPNRPNKHDPSSGSHDVRAALQLVPPTGQVPANLEAQLSALIRSGTNDKRWYNMAYQQRCLEEYESEIENNEESIQLLMVLIMDRLSLVYPCLPHPSLIVPVVRFTDGGDINIEILHKTSNGNGDTDSTTSTQDLSLPTDDPDCRNLINYSPEMMRIAKKIYARVYAYSIFKSTRRESGGGGTLNLSALEGCGLNLVPNALKNALEYSQQEYQRNVLQIEF